MKLKHLYILALPLLLAACSDKDEPGAVADGEAVELRLEPTLVGAQSRASYGLDTQFRKGTVMSLYVRDSQTRETLYQRIACINQDGTFSGWGTTFDGINVAVSDFTPMYFPANGHAVDIFAMAGAPNVAELDWVTAPTLAMYTCASQFDEAQYAHSDFCYAEALGVKPTKEAVELVFHHMLSKIELTVNEGGGTAGEVSAFYIPGDNLAVCAGWVFNEGRTTLSPNKNYHPYDITPAQAIGEVNECIILPQTLAQGTTFVRIEVAGGANTIDYKLPQDVTFEPGKRYSFNITVKANALDVTYTVSDWADGATTNGNLGTYNQALGASADGNYYLGAGESAYITGDITSHVYVAEGATLELRDVNISVAEGSAITVTGDATILLSGTNTLSSTSQTGCGIEVQGADTDLVIDGDGSLSISLLRNSEGAGIGSAGQGASCGNITVNGGTIYAETYDGCSIGAGAYGSTCGDIIINGGTISVVTLETALSSAIGAGAYDAVCGNIIITGGEVTATQEWGGYAIGSGYSRCTCGDVTISGGVVTTNARGIGAMGGSTIGTITFSGGAVVNGVTYDEPTVIN